MGFNSGFKGLNKAKIHTNVIMSSAAAKG